MLNQFSIFLDFNTTKYFITVSHSVLFFAVSFHMQEAKHGLLLHKTTNTNQNTSGEGVGEEYGMVVKIEILKHILSWTIIHGVTMI